MVSRKTIHEVQVMLNRLDLLTLGLMLAKCKHDEFGDAFRKQVLFAMDKRLDPHRMTHRESIEILEKFHSEGIDGIPPAVYY
jgi:hypothetical protein